MNIGHISRAKSAWPLLVRRARENGPPYTYGELCAELGLHHRAASWFLGVIQNYCKRHHLTLFCLRNFFREILDAGVKIAGKHLRVFVPRHFH